MILRIMSLKDGIRGCLNGKGLGKIGEMSHRLL